MAWEKGVVGGAEGGGAPKEGIARDGNGEVKVVIAKAMDIILEVQRICFFGQGDNEVGKKFTTGSGWWVEVVVITDNDDLNFEVLENGMRGWVLKLKLKLKLMVSYLGSFLLETMSIIIM